VTPGQSGSSGSSGSSGRSSSSATLGSSDNSGSSGHSGSSGQSGSSGHHGSSGPSRSSGDSGSAGSSGHPSSGLGSSGLSHISSFDVEPIQLGPVKGFHGGTGSFSREQLVVNPSSVPGTGNLVFLQANVQVTTKLYQISQQVVPNWFGVAIPDNVTDFTTPNIFFHPIPGQAGYLDADYPTKTGHWPELFYYMELLGYEVDGAIKNFGAPHNQIVIMPFLTSAATDAGIFPANWQGIVTDILTDVRTAMGGSGSGPVSISEVVVSSFSVGYVYSENFRRNAVGLQPLLKQVWDFDGYPKSDSSLLLTTPNFTAIKYDQGSEPGCIHVPLSRWADYPNPAPDPADWPAPKNGSDVHRSIRDYLFLDAATKR
jgi:hypothetical protein